MMQHQLVISEFGPCEENSSFPLPKELRNLTERLIKIQSKDIECFRWCLVKY